MDDFLHMLLHKHNIMASQVDIIQDNASTKKKDQETIRRSSDDGLIVSPVLTIPNSTIDKIRLPSSSSTNSSRNTRSTKGLEDIQKALRENPQTAYMYDR